MRKIEAQYEYACSIKGPEGLEAEEPDFRTIEIRGSNDQRALLLGDLDSFAQACLVQQVAVPNIIWISDHQRVSQIDFIQLPNWNQSHRRQYRQRPAGEKLEYTLTNTEQKPRKNKRVVFHKAEGNQVLKEMLGDVKIFSFDYRYTTTRDFTSVQIAELKKRGKEVSKGLYEIGICDLVSSYNVFYSVPTDSLSSKGFRSGENYGCANEIQSKSLQALSCSRTLCAKL